MAAKREDWTKQVNDYCTNVWAKRESKSDLTIEEKICWLRLALFYAVDFLKV
jgi:hypothetical protein